MELTRAFLLASLVAGLCLVSSAAAAQSKCSEGQVLREAFQGDTICVPRATRDLIAAENRDAEEHRRGEDCMPGYVWRLAGPRDYVCVTQDERDTAQRDNGNSSRVGARPSASPVPPLQIPNTTQEIFTPPATDGCHQYERGAWRDVPCVPARETDFLPVPAVPYSIVSNPHVTFRPPRGILRYTTPLTFASVDLLHLSDPELGKLTDSLLGADTFSIQVNTNYFTSTAGYNGWVQFVFQSMPDHTTPGFAPWQDVLCVWVINVDAQVYTPTCVYVPKQRYVWGPNDPWPTGAHKTTFVGIGAEQSERSSVAGYLAKGRDGAKLIAWAYLPWAPFTAYSVSVPDQIGLTGKWTQVSGDILGIGNGSVANFSHTKLRTVVKAASCTVGGAYYPCPTFTDPAFSFPPNATQSTSYVTAETNNLSSFYDRASHPPVFSCDAHTCTLDYSTGPQTLIKWRVPDP